MCMLNYCLEQGSQTHLGVRATLQDISQSAGRTIFRDDKMVWTLEERCELP